MAAPTSKRDGIDFLYPDLLSKEGLLHILKNRYVQIPTADLETLDKEILVDLYNKYVLPRPQRKYRDNLRGREMKKKQISRDKKRRRPVTEEDYSASVEKKGRLVSDSSSSSPPGPAKGLVNHFQSVNAGVSRLKPPPSCIDTSKKVVKLGSSALPASLSPVKVEEESNKAMVVVTSPGTNVVKLGAEGDGKANGAKKRSGSESAEDDGTSPGKKKISKISWP